MARSAGRAREDRRTPATRRPKAENAPKRREPGEVASRNLQRDEEILRVAAEIFYRQGFEGMTIDAIARDAGMGKTSLYHYFDSKEQIYERLVNNVIGTFDVQEELAREIPANERLEHFVRARLQQTTSHPIEVGLISRQLVRMDGPVGEWARKFRRHEFDSLRGLILEGQRDRRFRVADPDIMAATVMGLMAQVCDWYRPSRRVDRESLIDEIARFIVLGVRDWTRE